jgi:hypothetical protein
MSSRSLASFNARIAESAELQEWLNSIQSPGELMAFQPSLSAPVQNQRSVQWDRQHSG